MSNLDVATICAEDYCDFVDDEKPMLGGWDSCNESGFGYRPVLHVDFWL